MLNNILWSELFKAGSSSTWGQYKLIQSKFSLYLKKTGWQAELLSLGRVLWRILRAKEAKLAG